MARPLLLTIAMCAVCVALAGARVPGPPPPGTQTAAPAGLAAQTTGAEPAVLVGAGDIAYCGGDGDEATARLLEAIPGTVFTTGDNAYPNGTPAEFANCFVPTWGRHKPRIRPAAGNHDYHTAGAAGYFDYFGAAAGERGRGYYTYTLRDWLVIVLNSNCELVGGCGPQAPQSRWLRETLSAHRAMCTAAYWHHPRFSSGPHGPHASMQAVWAALYAAGADLVVTGHDHVYERFLPLDHEGQVDTRRGIRQFIVGTGGRSHYAPRSAASGSEVRSSGTFGVLKLSLWPDRYDWEFVPETGKTFRDRGTAACHQAPAPVRPPAVRT